MGPSIQAAHSSDEREVRAVYRAAFNSDEGEIVGQLAMELLNERTSLATCSWVAKDQDKVIGHVAFSPLTFEPVSRLRGFILAPLAVSPGYQKRSIGSQLVRHGLSHLTQQGVDLVLVYGDPDYYGRFGFRHAVAAPFHPPYPLRYPLGWQGCFLSRTEKEIDRCDIHCVPPLCQASLW